MTLVTGFITDMKMIRKLEIAEGLPQGSLVTLEDSFLKYVSKLENLSFKYYFVV